MITNNLVGGIAADLWGTKLHYDDRVSEDNMMSDDVVVVYWHNGSKWVREITVRYESDLLKTDQEILREET